MTLGIMELPQNASNGSILSGFDNECTPGSGIEN
jgi:hypothetical protein